MFSLSFNSSLSGNMERPSSSKPRTESSTLMQKLQNLLQHKEIKSTLLKLGIYSSEQSLQAHTNANIANQKCPEELQIVKGMSSSKEVACSSGKRVSQRSEMEELRERLRFIEEESKMMKQEFVEHVEEWKQLVNEIYQHFQVIYHCLQLENNPHLANLYPDEALIVNP